MAAEPERTFERPHRPPVIGAYNAVGRRLRRLGWLPDRLTEASILAAARRQTRLDDLPDEGSRQGLRQLIRSCRDDARLNPFGRLMMRSRLVELLVNRLRIEDDIRRHPEILDEPVRRPLIVTGLPRTGTTLLYNLLGQDPAGRPLLLWESTWPSPPPTAETRTTDPRIKRARRLVQMVDWLAPRFRTVHTLNPDGPEECLNLTFHTFVSPGFSMMADLRGYEEWLRQLSFEQRVAAYEIYRRQLQLLQWRRPGDHWVLKSPAHLGGLDALLTVLPDACVVLTHRDPAKAIPSVCSLFAILRGMGTDEPDLHAMGPRVAEFCAELVDRAADGRRAHPDNVIDVHYHDLVGDPIATVARIYDRFDVAYTPDAEAAMRAWLAADARDKKPPHQYDLAQFGLDTAAIDRLFGTYCERFDVPHEAPRC